MIILEKTKKQVERYQTLKKTKIIIATHGNFALGIYDSLRMISGEHEEIECLCAYKDSTIDYTQKIYQLVTEHAYDMEQLLVITDLLGGSVNNEFMKYIKDYEFYLLSGLNLGLLLEVALSKDHLDKMRIREILASCQRGSVLCNDELVIEDEENEF